MDASKALEIWAERQLDKVKIDYTSIYSVEDETCYDGYCETCYHEYTALVIRYNDADGKSARHETMYRLHEVLNELFKIADEGEK